jgi:hypothetical protein
MNPTPAPNNSNPPSTFKSSAEPGAPAAGTALPGKFQYNPIPVYNPAPGYQPGPAPVMPRLTRPDNVTMSGPVQPAGSYLISSAAKKAAAAAAVNDGGWRASKD